MSIGATVKYSAELDTSYDEATGQPGTYFFSDRGMQKHRARFQDEVLPEVGEAPGAGAYLLELSIKLLCSVKKRRLQNPVRRPRFRIKPLNTTV